MSKTSRLILQARDFPRHALSLAISGVVILLAVFGRPVIAGSMLLLGGGGKGVAPINNLKTPTLATFSLPTSGTATYYVPPVGASNIAILGSTAHNVPIPVQGAVTGLYAALNAAQAAAITANENGAAGSVACSFGGAISCNYSGAGDSIAAGTLLEWQWSTTSAWVQSSSSPGSISFLFTAANGQQGFLLSGPPNSAIPGATTNAWVGFGGVYVSVASDANVSSIMPTGGQIAGLYVTPNAPEASNLHVYTVWHNGSATGITCTPGTGTGGCCVNNYATPARLAAPSPAPAPLQ